MAPKWEPWFPNPSPDGSKGMGPMGPTSDIQGACRCYQLVTLSRSALRSKPSFDLNGVVGVNSDVLQLLELGHQLRRDGGGGYLALSQIETSRVLPDGK